METPDANGLACPMISIIIPVYKAEKYLHKCIDSIIAQSFKDWELLLIDDEDTLLLSDELLKGLDEELDDFLKKLLEEK